MGDDVLRSSRCRDKTGTRLSNRASSDGIDRIIRAWMCVPRRWIVGFHPSLHVGEKLSNFDDLYSGAHVNLLSPSTRDWTAVLARHVR